MKIESSQSIAFDRCCLNGKNNDLAVQGEGYFSFNRNRRKRPKVDASICDSALSHTRRPDASEKKEKKIACPLLVVFACGQVSSPRLYRLL